MIVLKKKFCLLQYTINTPSMIKVGTDCSGIDTPIIALKKLGIPYHHVFSCEQDKFARQSIEENFKPDIIYSNISTRDVCTTPKVDLYICGFPCQSFSSLGKLEGFKKSPIFFDVLKYIKQKLPSVFLLENVSRLVTHDKGSTFQIIMKELRSISLYNIKYAILNSLQYGLPQSRKRLYILGIKKSMNLNIDLIFPPSPRRHRVLLSSYLQSFSDWREVDVKYKNQSPHKLKTIKQLEKKHKDFHTKCHAVDLSASPRYQGIHVEQCPCLKASRSDYFVTSKGFERTLTPRETLRLQGIVPDELFKQVCSDRQTYKQAGNAMSVNVLCDIFYNLYLGQYSKQDSQDSKENL